ncbi:MAG: SMI1/KNR4 family protein [Deltaproteobacteria bacterium]|nr:SMI1/KNR4 family protein [Deltaproteobacteria bacterium]
MDRDWAEHVRTRLALLRALDEDSQLFGAARHEWTLAPPVTRGALESFERRSGVTLPDDLRGFLLELGASGAGPYYGLSPLPEDLEAAALAQPFIGDADPGDDTIMKDPERHGGDLELADHGCGYRSVLALTGPRRGQVFADLREAHDGIRPEAPSFRAWYDEWLDRALVEWAQRALPDLGDERSPELTAALTAVAPLIERAADPAGPRTPHDDLYPTSEADRLQALLALRIAQDRFDEALVLADRLPEVTTDEPTARRLLARARIAGAQGDALGQLEAADLGLADESLWFATRTALLRQREHALRELDRRPELLATTLERARHTREPFAYFDAAWLQLEDGDIENAAATLMSIGGDEAEGPARASLALDTAEPLFIALEDSEQADAGDALRAHLERLAAAS